jgi:cation-transporting ATPase E
MTMIEAVSAVPGGNPVLALPEEAVAGIATREVPAAAPPMLDGLSEAEVLARRAAGQGNAIALASSRSYRRILRDNALGSINVIIFAVGVALLVMGLVVDALVTVGVVLLNVGVAVVQEGRAKRQLDRIALLTRPRAAVVRAAQERAVDPAELVVGDLLVVRPGDQIVVDGEVVGGGRMEVDESLLSGESEPVSKGPGDPVYSGSFCVAGSATYEARGVGSASLANQLTQGARAFRQVKTPVQREVDLILRAMVILILAIGGPVVVDLAIRVLALLAGALEVPLAATLDRAYQAYSVEATVRAVAVVVGLVPQGLALMLTVAYAMGAVRLAGKGALLQQANAVESLSHVDVLCLDKTGTLTTNRLAYHALHPLAETREDLADALADFAASVTARNRTVEAIGTAFPRQARGVLTEVVFSSTRKWSALVFHDAGRRGLYVLGAPDVLMPSLGQTADLSAPLAALTAQGLRVLLLAAHPDAGTSFDADDPCLPEGLRPLGFISFTDELQADAGATLEQYRRAGVGLKIISGDHPETVAVLARQAGLGADGELRVVSGLDLAALDEGRLARIAEEATVFGRITPEQKHALVRGLQGNGHYVAMIGDGVNDVLALKQAEVGIAMQGGSQAARAIADLVLLGDSFAVLPAAFREGQRIVRGTQDLIKLFLARSLATALVIVGAAVVSAAFPVTPRLNALPAYLAIAIPTLALAAWARPAKVKRGLMRAVLPFALTAALTIAPVALTLYLAYLRTTEDVALARTVLAVVATLCGLVLLPFVEPPTPAWTGGDELSGDRRPGALALALLVLLAVILVVPSLRAFFELAPLAPLDVAIVGLAVIGWALALRFAWRAHLARRFFGMAADGAAG